jgi:hypothetical protein
VAQPALASGRGSGRVIRRSIRSGYGHQVELEPADRDVTGSAGLDRGAASQRAGAPARRANSGPEAAAYAGQPASGAAGHNPNRHYAGRFVPWTQLSAKRPADTADAARACDRWPVRRCGQLGRRRFRGPRRQLVVVPAPDGGASVDRVTVLAQPGKTRAERGVGLVDRLGGGRVVALVAVPGRVGERRVGGG